MSSGQSIADQVRVDVMPTWCDRFRPRQLDECLMHDSVNEQLRSMVFDSRSRQQLPHIMISGPKGSGKRTRATCLIAELYKIRRSELRNIYQLLPSQREQTGATETSDKRSHCLPTLAKALRRINVVVKDGVERVLTEEEQRCDERNVSVNIVLTRARTIHCDKAKDGLQVLYSPVHIEMTPHDVNFCDTKIVQNTLKKLFESNEFDLITLGAAPSLNHFAKSHSATESEKVHANAEEHVNPSFRIFVFNDVDKMSTDAQTALRRIMEDYSGLARFVLIATCPDHVIGPIQSRCNRITVPRPSDAEVRLVVESALVRALPARLCNESLFVLARPYIDKVVAECEGNVTRALTIMHASLHSIIDQPKLLRDKLASLDIAQPDWLRSVRQCVSQICQVSMGSNSTRHLYLKDAMCELLKRRVPTTLIVRYLDFHIRRTLSEQCELFTSAVDALLQQSKADQDAIDEQECRHLKRQLRRTAAQLAGVCSDVSTACAFYHCRLTKSQYPIIHMNALVLCLLVIVGLYQNNLAISLDANESFRVCRPYSSVYRLGKLLRHTMQHKKASNDKPETVSVVHRKKGQNVDEMQNVQKRLTQMCSQQNALAGVRWTVVRERAKAEGLPLQTILVDERKQT